MPDTVNDRLFLKSLAKGLSVLEAFTSQRPQLTLTQLSHSTGMDLAGVQRVTHTLQSLGYLGRNRRKEFFLAPRVLSLGQAFLEGSHLRQTAEPILADLSQELGYTVNLATLDGDEVVFITRFERERFFKFDLQPGSRLPAHCSALGKLLLAALPLDELERRLAEMELTPLTRYTITDRDRLRAELARVRRAGLAHSDREATLALHSLAAPILDQQSQVVAAINLSLPAEGIARSQRARLENQLLAAGQEISRLMGHDGPYPTLVPPATDAAPGRRTGRQP